MSRTMMFLLVVGIATAIACNLSIPTGQPPTNTPAAVDPAATFTAIAQTVIAEITRISFEADPTATPLPVTMTATSLPPDAPTLTPTPTATHTATITPLPTPTPVPATPTQAIPCLAASFVGDFTVPDLTTFTPGVSFTKIWQVKNIGSCTWTTQYNLVYVSGAQMSGKKTSSLPQAVPPGATVNLSLKLESPEEPDTYQGAWMLQAPDGKLFGVGQNADVPITVKVKVIASPAGQAFNFAINLCAASWSNGDHKLPCPGAKGSSDGFVTSLAEPRLENGRTEDEPTLWMFPEKEAKGQIVGEYPSIRIEAGDRFVTHLGCLADSPKCQVTFRLDYRLNGDNTVHNLGLWEESYDGVVTIVELDLSSLAGQEVVFILTVKAKAAPDDDNAFWLSPHIER